MMVLRIYGNTFGIKEELKADKFRWDSYEKCWWKNFNLNEKGISEEYVKNLAEAFETEDGVTCEISK